MVDYVQENYYKYHKNIDINIKGKSGKVKC